MTPLATVRHAPCEPAPPCEAREIHADAPANVALAAVDAAGRPVGLASGSVVRFDGGWRLLL